VPIKRGRTTQKSVGQNCESCDINDIKAQVPCNNAHEQAALDPVLQKRYESWLQPAIAAVTAWQVKVKETLSSQLPRGWACPGCGSVQNTRCNALRHAMSLRVSSVVRASVIFFGVMMRANRTLRLEHGWLLQ
jgi:predicted RNA-binding Zn-ribbon protein involved in translation (DUF1610 family)